MILGGIFTEAPSSAAAALIGSTGLLSGAAHYAAILADCSKGEVERATAIGFFLGFGFGAFVLKIDVPA